MKSVLAAALAFGLCGCSRSIEIQQKSGEFILPKGEVKLRAPIVIDGADGLTVKGDGTRLVPRFQGSPMIIVRGSKALQIEDVTLVGGGVVVESSDNVLLSKLTIREVPGSPLRVTASANVTLREVFAADSKEGILFENSCDRLVMERCRLRNIRSHGVWVRGNLTKDGRIEGNEIRFTAGDALRISQASGMHVNGNRGAFIGFPTESMMTSAAMLSAESVDTSEFLANQFEEVNGTCLTLTGVRDSAVRGNECVNSRKPDAYPRLAAPTAERDTKNVEIVRNKFVGFR